jgi:hypothetical protein
VVERLGDAGISLPSGDGTGGIGVVFTEFERDRGRDLERNELARDLGCNVALDGEAGGMRTALDTGTASSQLCLESITYQGYP